MQLRNKAWFWIVITALFTSIFFLPMGTQSIKQRLLQLAYPVLMRITKMAGANATVLQNNAGKKPVRPIYQLNLTMSNGKQVPLEQFRGRKLLLVNTASDCGYTGQYEELQQLWTQHKGQLEIIGFPANDFKEQEKGSDAAIEQFCKINYGVQFPLAQKSQVIKGNGQNPVFTWLTQAQQNGWNEQAPQWNFSKYLVNEQGVLTHYFGPSVSPLDKEIQEAIAKKGS